MKKVIDSYGYQLFMDFLIICFNTLFISLLQGYVTTLRHEDLPTLRRLMGSTPPEIVKAGLHPTADQIETFAYHLPGYPLSKLIVGTNIFNPMFR